MLWFSCDKYSLFENANIHFCNLEKIISTRNRFICLSSRPPHLVFVSVYRHMKRCKEVIGKFNKMF